MPAESQALLLLLIWCGAKKCLSFTRAQLVLMLCPWWGHIQCKDFWPVKCLRTVELCSTLWPFIFLGMHAIMSVWNTGQGDCHNQLPEPWRKCSPPVCPLFGENSRLASQGVSMPIVRCLQKGMVIVGPHTVKIRTGFYWYLTVEAMFYCHTWTVWQSMSHN